MFGHNKIALVCAQIAICAAVNVPLTDIYSRVGRDSVCAKEDFNPAGLYKCQGNILVHDEESNKLALLNEEDIVRMDPRNARGLEIKQNDDGRGNTWLELVIDEEGQDSAICLLSNFPSDTANKAFCADYKDASTWNLEWSNECTPDMMYVQGTEPKLDEDGPGGFPYVLSMTCKRTEDDDNDGNDGNTDDEDTKDDTESANEESPEE